MIETVVFATVRTGERAPETPAGFSRWRERPAPNGGGTLYTWTRETPRHQGDTIQLVRTMQAYPQVVEIEIHNDCAVSARVRRQANGCWPRWPASAGRPPKMPTYRNRK